jgi:hypothetical protein
VLTQACSRQVSARRASQAPPLAHGSRESLLSWLLVATIGIVPTVIATITFLSGMAIVGPTRACVLASFEVG